MSPTILAATWSDGLFAFSGDACHRELEGQSVSGLTSDRRGGALAIADGHSICRRVPGGEWKTIATSGYPLACCVAVENMIYAGTDGARVLRVVASGDIEGLVGFESVPGRDTWYPGTAVISGQVLGPPLGIRSITATADGAVLLANVHVGGIPRSKDGGNTWQATIDIESDVHEVCAHPVHPEIVVAAAAIGLCVSRDSGATWTVETEGLHALYCSAVAFVGNDVLVAASTDHFAAQGAVYRRSINGKHPLTRVGGGFPAWTDGIVDTGCIASGADVIAIADKRGNVYVSADAGDSWSPRATGLPDVSSIFVV